MAMALRLLAALLLVCASTPSTLAWGDLGHRTVAAIAMLLIPEKAAKMNVILAQLEMDGDFVDAASYPDEFIRDDDPRHKFNSWHYADLPMTGHPSYAGNACSRRCRQRWRSCAKAAAGRGKLLPSPGSSIS
jgi:hypothetical protein